MVFLGFILFLTFVSRGLCQATTANPQGPTQAPPPGNPEAPQPPQQGNVTPNPANPNQLPSASCAGTCQPSACTSSTCPAFANSLCIVDLCGCNARFLTMTNGQFTDVTAFCLVNKDGQSTTNRNQFTATGTQPLLIVSSSHGLGGQGFGFSRQPSSIVFLPSSSGSIGGFGSGLGGFFDEDEDESSDEKQDVKDKSTKKKFTTKDKATVPVSLADLLADD